MMHQPRRKQWYPRPRFLKIFVKLLDNGHGRQRKRWNETASTGKKEKKKSTRLLVTHELSYSSPMEVSSKRKVGRFRDVVETASTVSRRQVKGRPVTDVRLLETTRSSIWQTVWPIQPRPLWKVIWVYRRLQAVWNSGPQDATDQDQGSRGTGAPEIHIDKNGKYGLRDGMTAFHKQEKTFNEDWPALRYGLLRNRKKWPRLIRNGDRPWQGNGRRWNPSWSNRARPLTFWRTVSPHRHWKKTLITPIFLFFSWKTEIGIGRQV